MKLSFSTTIFLIIILTMQMASSAHYIVGRVENALDGTSSNGRSVRLWNPITSEEIFGVVGPSGASQTSNIFMIDCNQLTTSCVVGDKLNLTVVDDGTGYVAKNIVEVTVTGAGFDTTENLTINSPSTFINLTVEDAFPSPLNEIDLTPNSTTNIECTGVVKDYEGATSILNITSQFYSSTSFWGDTDDNNHHYTNSSCNINTSYGLPEEAFVKCSLQIEYYANQDTWQCTLEATDNSSTTSNYSDSTSINGLLALGVDSPKDFGVVNATEVTSETTMQVTNFGNVQINLSLSGYGVTEGDGDSMNCSGNNIPIYETKYNLTSSTLGVLTHTEMNFYYTNLSSTPIKENFNLTFRKNDTINNAKKNTYWRIYMPIGVRESCKGNIVFGATQG